MTKFLRSIFSNILTLLMSLLLAILIWFNALQTNDPVRQEILPVPIQFVGMPADAILVETSDEIVQVRFEGTLSLLSDVTANDFTVVADLNEVIIGETTTVPVTVQTRKSGLTILFQAPEQLDVLVERLASRDIEVVTDIRGSVASGHTQGTPLIDPETITVSGTESQIANINEARVTVVLNNVRETKVDTLQPIFYDLQGRVTSVSNLELSTNQVQVTIPVSESDGFADKTINANITGQPAEGYRLLSVVVEPATVLVQGRQTQLDIISRVQTEPIDITGLVESTSFGVTLNLPEGVTRDSLEPITVTVDIAPSQSVSIYNREVTLQGLDETLTAVIEPEEVRVVLFGPLPALNTLLDSEVQLTVDLFGLEAGVYSLAPTVSLPDRGIEVRSINPALVSVSLTPVLTPTAEITETSSLPLTLPLLTTAVPDTTPSLSSTSSPFFAWLPTNTSLLRVDYEY